MNPRKFVFVAVVVSLTCLVSADRAAAQAAGTVTWDAGFPQPVNAPPGQPNGSVIVSGSYTVNAPWVARDASFVWKAQGGGVLQSQALNFQNGKLGFFNANNVIAPADVGPIPKGTWEGELVVRYQDPTNPMNPHQIVVSSTALFTIN